MVGTEWNSGSCASANNQKEDAHYGTRIEFASRRAHRNNVDARRDFFLVDVSRHHCL